MGDEAEFQVVHALRLARTLPVDAIATRTHRSLGDTQRLLGELARQGYVRAPTDHPDVYRLTEAGAAFHARSLRDRMAEPELVAALTRLYDAFCEMNEPLKALCTRWQVHGTAGNLVMNDHTNSSYDKRIIAELAGIDAPVRAALAAVPAREDRFADYGRRLKGAWTRLRSGDLSAFTKPLSDSYHDVWMELHQDLLISLGRARSAADGD